jgi:HK97 family phage major capsid protein
VRQAADHAAMQNLLNQDRPVPQDARASIARELSRYYHELSGVDGKPTERFSLGRVLKQMATGGLRDGYEREICASTALLYGQSFDHNRIWIPLEAMRRDMGASIGPSGGYLTGVSVPDAADVLRPWSVAAEAGVQVVAGLRDTLAIPRVTTAGAAYWVSEFEEPDAEANPAIGSVTLSPKTAISLLSFSHQWRRQADGAEAFLVQQLMGGVGKLLDTAFFAGTGQAQPLGLVNTPGINTTTGANLAHAGVLEMRRKAVSAGGREERLRWVGDGATQELLGARERASGGGRFLWDSDGVLGRPAHATATAPASTLICGDFGQAIIGIWGPAALRLEIDPSQDFNSGGLVARVLLMADVAFPQTAAFSVATGVS